MKANACSLRFGMTALSCSCKTHKRIFSKQKYYRWWVSLFPKLPMVFSAPLCCCAAASPPPLLLLLLLLQCYFFFFSSLFFYLFMSYISNLKKNLSNSVEFLINGKYGERERERERNLCMCVWGFVWRKVKERKIRR